MSARVIHISEISKFPDAIYIGRAVPRRGIKASKWANPYRIGPKCDRSSAIDCYQYDLIHGDKRHMLADLPELQGRPLACWCRTSDEEWRGNEVNGCHGDLLVALVNLLTDDELRAMAREGLPAASQQSQQMLQFGAVRE